MSTTEVPTHTRPEANRAAEGHAAEGRIVELGAPAMPPHFQRANAAPCAINVSSSRDSHYYEYDGDLGAYYAPDTGERYVPDDE